MSAEDALADLTRRLEAAAERLRREDLAPDAAAELVDECARVATEAAAELDRRARAAADPSEAVTRAQPEAG
jgi:hypothetical protein